MAEQNNPYTQRILKGRVWHGILTGSHHALWLGPDHFLYVRTKAFSAEYRRFFFKDLQAMAVRSTDTWSSTSIVLGLLTVAGLVGGYFAGSTATDRMFLMAAFSLLPVVFLVANLALGPTCMVQLFSAIQTEAMPCRLRNAQHALNIVSSYVEHEQGGGYPGSLDARLGRRENVCARRARFETEQKKRRVRAR